MLFSMFPTMAIEIDGEIIRYPDIFRRVAKNRYLEDSTYLDTYTILDGERPEHVAYKIYDNAMYHWIILIANNILDIHHDWPYSSHELINLCKDKYGENGLYQVHHYAYADDISISVDYDATAVQAGEIVAITNYDYEARLNDEKSEIIILKPEYISEFIGQFKSLIRK